ncbi:calcium-transporting ATPase 2, plasma membrane-type-like protein [Tanacetum coccineum]
MHNPAKMYRKQYPSEESSINEKKLSVDEKAIRGKGRQGKQWRWEEGYSWTLGIDWVNVVAKDVNGHLADPKDGCDSQSSSENIDGFSFGSKNLRQRKQLIQLDKSHRPVFYGYWSRKRYVMTFMGVVLELLGGGVRAHCKGASEIVLAACDKVINENALGTLCLAYIDLESGVSAETPIPSSGYTCIGILGSKDNVRPGVKESLALFRSTGITFRMVTRDDITTAKSIARECGILTDDGIAINGADFREKSLEVLLIIIPKIQVVAVTGDGTNDSLSLHEAIIRLSIGIGALLELK